MEILEMKGMEDEENGSFFEEEVPKFEMFDSSMGKLQPFDMTEFGKGYLEAQVTEKQEEVASFEAAYAAMPDKTSLKAQYLKLWIEYKKDELKELANETS